jgi:hypothetical protein
MKRTSIRPISLAVIVLVVLGIVVVMQVQVMAEYVQHQKTILTDAHFTPRGPEADPYLRHAPGGYDFELEPPPQEIP